MKCVAIDDEPFALKILEEDICKIDFIEGINCFTNLEKAKEFLSINSIDLLFLDIEMPKQTGIEFLTNLESPPMVIFTTAYTEYALNGFDLNAVDYLLKPISFERLERACLKAFELLNLKKGQIISKSDFILVFSEYNKVRINIEDIVYIEGLKDYVKIYTKTQVKPILTRMSLKKILLSLSAEKFIRIHQSYIVSTNKIVSFQKHSIIVENKTLPIGNSYFLEVNSRLNTGV